MSGKVAIFWPGIPGEAHHRELYEPAAAIHVGHAIKNHVDEVHIFAMERHGFSLERLMTEMESFSPDVLLASVPVSGYYPQTLEVVSWAKKNNIPSAMGGYHFGIPHTNIARIAAEQREVPIAYGQAIETAPALVEALLGKRPMAEVPGIQFKNVDIQRTPVRPRSVSELPHPILNTWGYEKSWENFRTLYPDTQEKYAKGRQVATGILLGAEGCKYRERRQRLEDQFIDINYPAKEEQGLTRMPRGGCAYCTLSQEIDHSSPQSLRRKLTTIADLVREHGYDAAFMKEVGDDTASRPEVIREWIPVVKEVEEQTSVQFLFNMYAWLVPQQIHAEQLRELGVVHLYIGADGKEFSSTDLSRRNPLIKTLENLQKVGIEADIGYVLGGEIGQTWRDVKDWLSFSQFVWDVFGDTVRLNNGWPYIAAPGDPNWHHFLSKKYPEFNETDNPNLEEAQRLWFKDFTNLGENAEQVILEEIMPQYAAMSRVERTYFVEP